MWMLKKKTPRKKKQQQQQKKKTRKKLNKSKEIALNCKKDYPSLNCD